MCEKETLGRGGGGTGGTLLADEQCLHLIDAEFPEPHLHKGTHHVANLSVLLTVCIDWGRGADLAIEK
jgi:hypothetical protein